MKKHILSFAAVLSFIGANAQGTFCDPNGNLVLITNYDGGVMNINVDVSIPNLKIGIVTYEAVQVNLSGSGLASVTEVRYAGYNGTNDNCGTGVTNTSINGAPGGAGTSITLYPAATLANGNGYGFIICGYSCDITTNQGGCNTADQIEDYWATVYPGSSLRFHRIQYNCISSTINLTGGGNCCALATPLSAIINTTNTSCADVCDGSATAVPGGGQPPYTYQWTGGPSTPTYTGLCPGVYTVMITDGASTVITQQVTITGPPAISATATSTPDNGTCNGTITVSPTGGNGGPYTYLWPACGGSSTTSTALNVCAGTCCVTVTDAGGCQDTICQQVNSTIGINEMLNEYHTYIYPNPSENGIFNLECYGGKLNDMNVYVTDVAGRKISFTQTTTSSVNSTLTINGSAGVYYVVFETPAGMFARKVLQK